MKNKQSDKNINKKNNVSQTKFKKFFKKNRVVKTNLRYASGKIRRNKKVIPKNYEARTRSSKNLVLGTVPITTKGKFIIKTGSRRLEKKNIRQAKKAIKKERALYRKSKKSIFLKILDFFLILSFIIFAAGLYILYDIIATRPTDFDITKTVRPNDTLVYDKNKEYIGRISMTRGDNENVSNTSYNNLNQSLINTLMATEDSKFFIHNGFDLSSTLENGFKTVILKTGSGGGSTITQQLIGAGHLDKMNDSSIKRKVREIYLSIKAENYMSKEDVLEAYLNYFGFGKEAIHGVDLASKYFFNKDVNSLDYVESSILVGTLNAPTLYNPLGGYRGDKYVNHSQTRYYNVLLANLNQGYISGDEFNLLRQVSIPKVLDINSSLFFSKYQSYLDVVAIEVRESYELDPTKETLKIYTFMDPDAQDHANEITNGKHVTVPDKTMNFGFVVSETQTGHIVALSGGKQYRGAGGAFLFNNAVENKTQPGSAFKPIAAYAPTFELLHWGNRAPISNDKYKYPNGMVVNNVDNTSGGVLTIDSALASSRNLTALRAYDAVVDEVGVEVLTKFVNSLGFDFDTIYHSYALGGLTYGVTPAQMNGAYQAFGNGGYYIKPHTIDYMVTEDDSVIENVHVPVRVMDEGAAFMMATALELSVGIPSAYANVPGYNKTPFAAKTGTSNWDETGAQYGIPNLSPRDSWMSGFTTEYTMSIWGGYDAAQIRKGKYPGWINGEHEYPGKIWANMMTFMANGKEKSYLDMKPPKNVTSAAFNPVAPAPFRLPTASNYAKGYFFKDNLPDGYYVPPFNPNYASVSLAASVGSVGAYFPSTNEAFTANLSVNGVTQSVQNAPSLFSGVRDGDIVRASITFDGSEYAIVSKCYFAGNLYNYCQEYHDAVAREQKKEADRVAREEAERKAREEAERKAREEAERKAREEAERKAREEAERKAREEAERIAREEAERRAQE